MQENARKSGDLWSGISLALLGLYIVVQARQWDYMTDEGPGAGFFPLWYGIGMVVLSLVLVAGAMRSRGTWRVTIDRRATGRALTTWGALALSIAAFSVLGFVISFALLCFFIVAVMYRRPLRVAAAVAVLNAAGFYLVFPLALGVSLPTGLLGF
jgi:putative tricarboxylic transport membrane protein